MPQHLVRHRVALADDQERAEVDRDGDHAREERGEDHRGRVFELERRPARQRAVQRHRD